MDLITIFNKKLILAILLLGSFSGIAQTKFLDNQQKILFDSFLSSLHDTNNETASISFKSENCLLITMTDRTCLGCYTALEKYVQQHYEGYKVNIIVMMQEEPLMIKDKKNALSRYYKSFDNIYFYYYEYKNLNDSPSFIRNLINSPSPYFFIINKDSDKIKYIDYPETTRLIYPKS